jgi:hypothetical protein
MRLREATLNDKKYRITLQSLGAVGSQDVMLSTEFEEKR